MALLLTTAHKLYRSPIVRIYLVLALSFWALFYAFGQRVMNLVLDGYTVVGCTMVAWRFGPEAWLAIQKPRPQGSDILIVSVVGVCLSILGLRLLRLVGLELGVIDSDVVGYLFGALTTLMVYSIHLKVVAPRIRLSERWLNPWVALVLSLGGGAAISALLLLVRL